MVRVLGPFRVSSESDPRPILEGRTGALLQILLLHPNQTVGLERLANAIWPTSHPLDRRLRERIRVLVSRLRRRLGGELNEASAITLIREGDGYRLEADEASLDRVAFEAAAEAAIAGDHNEARRALDLWGGDPYTGFTDSPDLRQQRTQLIALRKRVEQVLAAAHGDHEVVATHLGSRFSPPMVDGGPIVRRELLDSLPSVGETHGLYVVAPPGFGKSVLLAQWAREQAGPVSWLNVSIRDNDPARFWSSVVESLRSADIPLPAEMGPDAGGWARTLLTLLSDSPQPIGLVLDDVHELVEAKLISQLGAWISSLPDTVTIGLGSRRNVSFGAARLESMRRFHRVTPAKLKLTASEISEIAAGVDSDVDQSGLLDRTEGWPLAVTYLMGAAERKADPDATTSLTDFVVDEVLDGAPERVVSFVLSTAHLELLHADLCDAVTQRSDSAEILEWLARRQLLVVGETEGRMWRRYHHLFSSLIRRRAEADPTIDVPLLHQRAAKWYHERRLSEDALGHALVANDAEMVAETSGDVLLRTALNAEFGNCLRWWHALDPDELRVNRRSHDIGMMVAIHWSDDTSRQPWMESRLHWFGGEQDTILTYAQAVEDTRHGRVSAAVDRVSKVIDQLPMYCDEHIPDLSLAMLGQAYSTLFVTRVLEGETRHDDPELERLMSLLRPGGQVAVTWLYGCWAFLAYIDGATDAAAAFAELFEEGKSAIEGLTDTPAALGVTTSTLLASDETTNAEDQIALSESLLSAVEVSRLDGAMTEVALARLALHRILTRAGAVDEAYRQLRLADAVIRSFEDAKLVDRARQMMVEEGIESDVSDLMDDGDATEGVSALTDREETVLSYLDSDLTVDDIAQALYVSANTIKSHMRSIYRKLGVNTRLQAVRRLRSTD